MTDTLQAWHDQWQSALKVLGNLADILQPPPAGGNPQDRLPLLLDIFTALKVPLRELSPARACARRWGDRIASNVSRGNVADWIWQALDAIELAMARCGRAGGTREAIICPQDLR